MKRVLLILSLLLVLPLVSSTEDCTIVERASCTTNIVMGISSLTNAHGELASQGNYDYVLCCDFGTGDTTCSGTNKIIGLEYVTNAHAEIPGLDNYANDICYEELVCTNKTSCISSEMPILSLSSGTDAHIGAQGDYATKICCTGMCEAGEEYFEGECVEETTAYWANTNSEWITEKEILIDSTTILLLLKNSRLPEGTEVTFEVFEFDPISNDDIRTGASAIVGYVDANENVEVSLILTSEDMEKAYGFLDEETSLDDDFEFIFEASWDGGSESSIILNITLGDTTGCGYVTLCSNYENQGECESDICSVGDFSVENKDSSVSCGTITQNSLDCNIWTSCGCEWKDNSCGPKKTENIQADCEDGSPSIIGSCFYNEATSDNCDDGFLSYSWGGQWTWSQENIEYFNTNGIYYDPDNKVSQCSDGSKAVPCPAQIRLPFFGILNLIIAIILILSIYFLRKRIFVKKKISKKKKR